jgi:hypothetical protein
MALSDTKKPFRGARKGCRDGRMVVVRSDYGAAQVRGRWASYRRAKLLAKAAVGVRSIAVITKPMRMLMLISRCEAAVKSRPSECRDWLFLGRSSYGFQEKSEAVEWQLTAIPSHRQRKAYTGNGWSANAPVIAV